MIGPDGIGRLLLIAGIIIALVGVIFMFGNKIPLIGRLPGDFSFGAGSVRVYFPLATMLIISILLTIALNVIGRCFK